MTDPAVAKAADHALLAIRMSTAAWGVRDCHWLPEPDDERPTIFLTTATDAEKRALDAAPWLASQVTMMLARQGMPYEAMKGLRIFVDSREGRS